MNIFLLTTIYPSKFSPRGTTPVVHYFAVEWARMGHNVHVFHTETLYPRLFFFIGKVFESYLNSLLGFIVPTRIPAEYDEIRDGVKITHMCLKKNRPHGRFTNAQLNYALERIASVVEKEGGADSFIGHWDNPQLELLYMLKCKYDKPTCLVFHDNVFTSLSKKYGNDLKCLIDSLDIIGFRNETAKNNYEILFGKAPSTFIAASGVSRPFIEAGINDNKTFTGIHNFIYVGMLIERKFPVAVSNAIQKVFESEPFKIVYVGDGEEKRNVERSFRKAKSHGKLLFTGRISRESVISYLKESDVFVMISKGEIFGLVYLEAMALGCITIASRHEGLDGIIEDGVNGFLCEAGNTDELEAIIRRIRSMRSSELELMSNNAKITARYYSDAKVAERYIHNIEMLCKDTVTE